MTHTTRKTPIEAVDPTVDPMAPPEYAIRSIVDGLDQIAAEMERKWGVGRLRLLVGEFLCAKFDAQTVKLDAAIRTNRETYIRAQAEGMKRAWAALDRTATEAGHAPLSPQVWECVLLSSGDVIAIVRTDGRGASRLPRVSGVHRRRDRPAN